MSGFGFKVYLNSKIYLGWFGASVFAASASHRACELTGPQITHILGVLVPKPLNPKSKLPHTGRKLQRHASFWAMEEEACLHQDAQVSSCGGPVQNIQPCKTGTLLNLKSANGWNARFMMLCKPCERVTMKFSSHGPDSH